MDDMRLQLLLSNLEGQARHSSATTAIGKRVSQPPTPKALVQRNRTPNLVPRHSQAGRTSGCGVMTLFSESVKRENKFIVLKQEARLNYKPKNPFSSQQKPAKTAPPLIFN